MTTVPLRPLATTLMFALTSSAWADATVFVLRRAGPELALEAVELREGESRTWRCGEDGFIDIVLPPGPGGSAGVTQATLAPVTQASLQDGRLTIVTTAGGKRYERPVPDASARAALDVHVSARDASGATLAAFIREDRRVAPDPVGVIEDPFGDALPLQPGDCIVFTSTYSSRTSRGTRIVGEAPVEFTGGHHLVAASIAGGGEGRWVVDLAAGSTIVERGMLPPGATIEPAVTAQYSAEGVVRLAAEIGGATSAATPLGYVVIPELRIGGLVFRDVEALVMERLPPVGEGVTGILGLDLLSRASSVTLPFPTPGVFGMMRLGAPSEGEPAVSTPIATLGSRSYCKASVNGAQVCFVIDTGAPRTILDVRAAALAGVEPDGETKQVRGIGSDGATLRGAVAKSIVIGGAALNEAPVEVGALPLFSRFRGPLPVGILGNSTLARFDALTLDFENERLLLWNAPDVR